MENLNLFYKIFIAEDSYIYILKGVGVTVEITLLSVIFGTILGGVVCFFRMGQNRFLKYASSAYIEILRGSPVLMLLMLLFYGVFAKSDFSPVTVAIFAFSMNASAHIAEIIRSAISATDYGQVEAARTLGFSRTQAFKLITLPQLAHIARPVYQSAVINLLQWTSVVGYISITDLTRVIYNTASRTMQPFITIFVGMIIYLLISYAIYGIFAYVGRNEEREGETL